MCPLFMLKGKNKQIQFLSTDIIVHTGSYKNLQFLYNQVAYLFNKQILRFVDIFGYIIIEHLLFNKNYFVQIEREDNPNL